MTARYRIASTKDAAENSESDSARPILLRSGFTRTPWTERGSVNDTIDLGSDLFPISIRDSDKSIGGDGRKVSLDKFSMVVL